MFAAAVAAQETFAAGWCAAEDELECTPGGWALLVALLSSAAAIAVAAVAAVRGARRRRAARERRSGRSAQH